MITEVSKKTMQNGEHYYTVPRWKYVLNWWTPIATLTMVGIAMLAWFNNADGRMFTTQEMKVQAENHIKTAMTMEDRYVTREEFQQFLEIQKENRSDIKEILKYLRK